MKSLTIIGRRWFRRSYGGTYFTGTYFTAVAIIDGIQCLKIGPEYGYGDQYLYEVIDRLDKDGFLPSPIERHANGGHEAAWRYCERNGIAFSYSVSDVARERDL